MEFLTQSLPRKQRGLSLLYALLALAALALSTIALVRSISTTSIVAGNLAFQQDATAAADQATQQVITTLYNQLTADTSSLNADDGAIGYYASSSDLIDVTGSQTTSTSRQLVKWFTSNDEPEGYNYCDKYDATSYASCAYTPVTLPSVNGNTVRYVVFRLCSAAGDASADAATRIYCAKPLSSSSTQGGNEVVQYGTPSQSSNEVSPYYRIVVRVSGARNTVSYTETIVHF